MNDGTTIERSTEIDTPLERVFEYYSTPENLPEIWPSLLEVRDVHRNEEGTATRFGWTYKMGGMRFDGVTDVTEFERNRRYLSRSKGGIESVNEIRFEDLGGRTRVIDRVTYRVPIPLLGRIAERALTKMNENEMAAIHENLKARLEGQGLERMPGSHPAASE